MLDGSQISNSMKSLSREHRFLAGLADGERLEMTALVADDFASC